MTERQHHWLSEIGFTVAIYALITMAVMRPDSVFAAITPVAIVAGVGGIYLLFPRSRFFAIALADFLAVYACVFIFFIESNFRPVSPWAEQVSFALPVLAFVGGCWWQRHRIRRVVRAQSEPGRRAFAHSLIWLLPVLAIGGLTFLIPGLGLDQGSHDALLLAAMTAIAATVLVTSHDVASFLIDTGLLLEGFFERISRLVVPGFVFLTFYSLLVIVFATVYRIIDRFSGDVHFAIQGVTRDLTFPEAVYFSIITLSTVGYGDITPASNVVRVVVAVQIVCGVMLLLFGFYEINSYAREHERLRGGHETRS